MVLKGSLSIRPQQCFPGRQFWDVLSMSAKLGMCVLFNPRSQIHESSISLRFLGIILSVLRLKVFVYNVYIKKKFQPFFARRGGGSKIRASKVTVNSKAENSLVFFCPNYVRPRIRLLDSVEWRWPGGLYFGPKLSYCIVLLFSGI